MRGNLIPKERANKVYDLLVSIGGANEKERDSFLYAHCEDEYPCMEWRFGGHLGSGGKYRSTWNGVTYYGETQTPEMILIKDKLDEALKEI
jgi:hypothetical protein